MQTSQNSAHFRASFTAMAIFLSAISAPANDTNQSLLFVIPNSKRGKVSGIPPGWVTNGSSVTLTAEPPAGLVFFGWDGDVLSTNQTVTFPVTKNTFVNAIFGSEIQISTAGPGTIVKPEKAVPFDNIVRITAIPDPGAYFVGWRDTAGNPTEAGKSNPLGLSLSDQSQPLVATFAPLPPGTATFVLRSVGNGNTFSEFVSPYYPLGTEIQIDATPYAGEKFIAWTGDVQSPAPVHTFILDGSKVITGHFTTKASLRLATAANIFTPNSFGLTASNFRDFEGRAYPIEESVDLKTWRTVGTLPFGSFSMTIPIEASLPNAVYRLRIEP